MDDRELAELAALPAILQHFVAERGPKHDDINGPIWPAVIEDANFLAKWFGGTYACSKRE